MTLNINKPVLVTGSLILLVLTLGIMLLLTKCSGKAAEPVAAAQTPPPAVIPSMPGMDTMQMHGTKYQDTTKVAIMYRYAGGAVKWTVGYSVSSMFVDDRGQRFNRGYNLFDEKWAAVAIPKESVLGAFPNDWK